MKENIQAYIDSFEDITILIDKSLYIQQKKFYLFDKNDKYELEILNFYEEALFFKYCIRKPSFVELNIDYYIEDENNNRCHLQSGNVVKTYEFEKRFQYDGPLGFEYSKNKTIFRIWTPVCKEVIIELIYKNTKMRIPLSYVGRGLWQCVVNGDLDGCGYIYYVRANEKLVRIHDPYAISTNANGLFNYVIDTNKLYKMKYKKPEFSGIYTDAVIYEASVRDFSYSVQGENRSTFLGMVENHPTESGEKTGIEYIASLGITHLQLMPIFEFGGVDDVSKNLLYNWGYNPEQYFIPCGWYSKNPDDPYSRLNELLELIDNSHRVGLRVVMDVVYNHVYKIEEFPFDFLVPGYFYRQNIDGSLSNATFCGNDLATERSMCSRLICDSLFYFVKMFKISGFRFDLMGLLDIKTLNRVYSELSLIEPQIILYGEGWNMSNPLKDEFRPHMFNHFKIPQYAFFNDRFRDIIRGSQNNRDGGFSFGSNQSIFDIYHLELGSCLDYFKFNEPTQTVNYVECHDNYTFYDYGKTYLRKEDYAIKDSARLALSLTILSLGIPFIHAGEEFLRTKLGVENSYNASDAVNMIDYSRRDLYIDMVNMVRDLINIRKKYSVFRMSNCSEISKKSHVLEGLSDSNKLTILYEDLEDILVVIAKKTNEELSLDSEKIKNGYKLSLIFDGYKACDKSIDDISLNDPGVYVLKGERKKWF